MLSRYFLSSFSNVENGKAARLLLIQRVKEHIAEMDIDPRMERFVLYISRHDIYQKFYTSRFSTIQKFTQKKPEDNKPVYRQSSTSSDDAEKPESWQTKSEMLCS